MTVEEIQKQFDDYIAKVKEEIIAINQATFKSLPDNPVGIQNDLETMIGYYARVNAIYPRVNQYYIIAQYMNLPAKDVGTEMARKVTLDNGTATYRYWKELLSNMIDVIGKRLSAGQSILKSFEKERIFTEGV